MELLSISRSSGQNSANDNMYLQRFSLLQSNLSQTFLSDISRYGTPLFRLIAKPARCLSALFDLSQEVYPFQLIASTKGAPTLPGIAEMWIDAGIWFELSRAEARERTEYVRI